MIEDRKLTAKEKRKWRSDFKTLGREAVRAQFHDFRPYIKRDLAVRWLREQEMLAEDREGEAHWYLKWTFVAAVVAAIAAILGIALMLAGY